MASVLPLSSLQATSFLSSGSGGVNNYGRDQCKGNMLTRKGKRWQIIRMILLVCTPVAMLIGLTGYFLVSASTYRYQLNKQKQAINDGREIGRLIHILQKERDQSALYASAIGPDTMGYLKIRYEATDSDLKAVIPWPEVTFYFRGLSINTREDVSKILKTHRQTIEVLNPTVREEIAFYTELINIFTKHMKETIDISRFAGIWKTVMAYQKIITCKEDVGIQRALGSSFFARGGFEDHDHYLQFMRKRHTFNYDYKTAQMYSPVVYSLEYELSQKYGMTFVLVWQRFNDQISSRNITKASTLEATRYYDNMTLLIDELFSIQTMLGEKTATKMNSNIYTYTKDIAMGALVMLVVAVVVVIEIGSVVKQISSMQQYAMNLVSKTVELNDERKKTESIVHQMLPKEIALALKDKKSVQGEYFNEVTLFFSEVNNFISLTKQCKPMEVINYLKEMYCLIDIKAGEYDVYKVENITDMVFIASGVPRRNGDEHASEIANMALDIVKCIKTMDSVSITVCRPQLRIGIHTGPVMAGVVGLKLPKYSLFGDTVNTAARMETNGKANKIHVSETTYDFLKNNKAYKFNHRGGVRIKGKGLMLTYWLKPGHRDPFDSGSSSSMDFSSDQSMNKKKISILGKGKEVTLKPSYYLPRDVISPCTSKQYIDQTEDTKY